MTRVPFPALDPIEKLTQLGFSGHEPLPTLIRGTCRDYKGVLTLGWLRTGFASYEDEVCVRCRAGGSTPTTSTDAPDDRVVYWRVPKDPSDEYISCVYINIHLRCLTPAELAWVWMHLPVSIRR